MSVSAPLRTAFVMIPRRVWAGGYNYQANLFGALSRYRPGEITPVVFASPFADENDIAGLRAIPGVEVVLTPILEQSALRLAAAIILGVDFSAAAAFRSHRIDVVFENARFFGWRLPFPTVAWLPDFQHRRLPNLFSMAARWRRDFGFRLQVLSGRTVLLSSESAYQDLKEFFPGADRAFVVRFATLPQPQLLKENSNEVLNKYGLPKLFFYLPNQFWRHKNHQIIIDALTVLAGRGINIVVAASGSKDDARDPRYFPDLMRQVEQRGLAANFRYLGMIPLPDVYALLRGCMALINPSCFEGWSTTVEEAKSFGVPMILSNIPVHREQSCDVASYFAMDDHVALANHLAKFVEETDSPPPQRDLLPSLDRRVEDFAADFAQVIKQAVQHHTSMM